MSDTIITASGDSIADTAVEQFQAGLRGPLLRPGNDAYDPARKLWNGMFDRKPALIARCSGAADVITAVNFAQDHGLHVAVRGGGHSIPGHSICDGGLLIDLSAMKGIRVDPAARAPNPASNGSTSIMRPRPSGWRRAAARCPTPASPA